MKSSSPLISVLVFGLSLFMLLKFGLGTGETLDEVVSAATPPEESLAMERRHHRP